MTFIMAFSATLCSAATGGVNKDEGSLFTAEMIANARRNVEKHDWAGKLKNSAVGGAAWWIKQSDEDLWNMVPSWTLRRGLFVGPRSKLSCPTCHKSGRDRHWNADPVNKPWKISCRNCGAVFPKNDFRAFYQSALVDGVFDPAKGDPKYLVNVVDDQKAPGYDPSFGVDNGEGWVDADGDPLYFAAYYCQHYGWNRTVRAIGSLADAWVFTGEQIYAHKAAVLLDRIADIYPHLDYHTQNTKHFGGQGKIRYHHYEGYSLKILVPAYDKIVSGIADDASLFDFLAAKARQYDHINNPKRSLADLNRNYQDGVIREAAEYIRLGKIQSNGALDRETMALLGIVLDENPDTAAMLDWIFQKGTVWYGSSAKPIPTLFTATNISRDGAGPESAPGYNLGCYGPPLLRIAKLLRDYRPYTKHDIVRDFPRMKKVLDWPIDLLMIDAYYPRIGDSSCGTVFTAGFGEEFYKVGFQIYRDPRFAQILYRRHKRNMEALYGSVYDPDPEQIRKDVIAAIERVGSDIILHSHNMNGYGLGILRTEAAEPLNAWLYYGHTEGHGHPDKLNIGLFAKGIEMLPDIGVAYFDPAVHKYGLCDNTLGHNTVLVNRQRQIDNAEIGNTYLFDANYPVKVMDISSPRAYPEAPLYRRTVAAVSVSADDAYLVDIFRVRGGHSHDYMLHTHDVPLTTGGLDLVAQEKGTLAGQEFEYAQPLKGIRPGSRRENDGFYMLKDVRWDANPGDDGYVDFAYERANMRVRMLNMAGTKLALTKGAVPPLSAGKEMHFLTCAREGGEDLASVFVTIIEPYSGEPLIASASLIPIEPSADVSASQQPIALRVQLTSGRTDYVIHCPDRDAQHTYDGRIRMAGAFAVASHDPDGQWDRFYLLGGTQLAAGELELGLPTPAYTGKIREFDRQMDQDNCIYTDIRLPEGASLRGQQILIYTEPPTPWYPPSYKAEGFPQLVTYRIEDVRPDPANPNGSAISVGEYVFTRGYKEVAETLSGNIFAPTRAKAGLGTKYWDYDSGVAYHFKPGDTFTILNSACLELDR